jgi:hypothetical protein
MVESFKELCAELNLIPVYVNWNEDFPFFSVMECYSKTPIEEKINSFIQAVKKKYPDARINNMDLYNLGLLADSFDLMLAYFVSSNTTIGLIFHDGTNTKEWMDQFKDKVNRRIFFSLVHSYRNFKNYVSPFPLSIFYNLYPSTLPNQCSKVKTYVLNKEYILVHYINDAGNPDYRVIKPGEVFEEFIPTVKYDPSKFNCLQFEFDNKVFTGDSAKYLFDGVEREYGIINEGCYHIDPREGVVWCDGDDYVENIPGMKTDPKLSIVFSTMINNKKVILLDNAMLWILPDNQFIRLKSIKGLETINADLFALSSEKKGIMVSLEPNTIECVSKNIFIRFLKTMLFSK